MCTPVCIFKVYAEYCTIFLITILSLNPNPHGLFFANSTRGGPKRPPPSTRLVGKFFKKKLHILKFHINIGLHRKNHTPEVKDKNFMSIWKFEVKIEEFPKCQLFQNSLCKNIDKATLSICKKWTKHPNDPKLFLLRI